MRDHSRDEGQILVVMRGTLIGLSLLVLAACGGSGLTMSEYGDRLNGIVDTYAPQAEAAWIEFGKLAEPTMEELETLFDRDVTTRIEVEAGFRDLDPPDEIAELHDLLLSWLADLTDADRALLARVRAVNSLDEFLASTEYQRFEETLLAGAQTCNEFQSQLDATAARGIFADTPWVPGDLEDVADAVIGCDAIPDDLDPTFS